MDEQANDCMQPQITRDRRGLVLIAWAEQRPDYVKVSPELFEEMVQTHNSFMCLDKAWVE